MQQQLFSSKENLFLSLSRSPPIVSDDNQLSDHLLWVHRQIHSRLRSSGVRADTSLLSRVREPAAGHGEAWAQLRRRAGRVREPLHRRSKLWELRYIWHGRLGFLLAGKSFIWSPLWHWLMEPRGARDLSQAHLSFFCTAEHQLYCRWFIPISSLKTTSLQ